MSEDTNGRIRLSWAQITWGLSVIIILLASWYDNRNQISLAVARLDARTYALESAIKAQNTYSRGEIDLMLKRADEIHQDLYDRLRARR